MKIASQIMMQTGAAHISIDQQHLAALVACKIDRKIHRDDALALLRQITADQNRLQAPKISKLLDARPKSAELFHADATLFQSGQTLKRWIPWPALHIVEKRWVDWRGRQHLGKGRNHRLYRWCSMRECQALVVRLHGSFKVLCSRLPFSLRSL